MSTHIAPALLSTVDDIIEYKVEDGSPADPNEKRKGYLERFIHSEIYKKFPSVNAVVHSHSPEVLPYAVNSVPLRATTHMAGFLGNGVPVWDIASAYSSMPSLPGVTGGDKEKHDLLVRTPQLGRHLAAAFKPNTSTAFLYNKMRAALPGAEPEPENEPSFPVILMRGHGFTTCAESLETAVFQAIYTKEAAKVQTAALLTNASCYSDFRLPDSAMEGSISVGEKGSGKISSGKVKGVKTKRDAEEIKYLSEREAGDTWSTNKETVLRPWEMWCREVDVNPLYRNEVEKMGDKQP